VAAGVRLSPAQEAWSEYVTHTSQCPDCRDIDQRCAVVGALWRAWWDLAHEAARIIAGE
jgi:hypothetical protein